MSKPLSKSILIIPIIAICFVVIGLFLGRSPYMAEKVWDAKFNFFKMKEVVTTTLNPEIELKEIRLEFKEKDFAQLKNFRDKAMKNRILISKGNDYVDVNVYFDGKKQKAKTRLKGDWTDHLDGWKWSYRVKMKDEGMVFGMPTFSLQHPKTREYTNEWFFHQVMKDEGFAHLRYKFVRLFINDKDLGVYAFEEHFDKYLIENSELREGPILKFNEDLLWENRRQEIPHDITGFESSPIGGFKEKKIFADSALKSQFLQGMAMLEAFRQGNDKASNIFNMEKMAKYYALCDLLGARHALFWHNLRFYYNPVTGLLEPVAFDGNAGILTKYLSQNLNNDQPYYFGYQIFQDKIFIKEYHKQLLKVSGKGYLEKYLGMYSQTLYELDQIMQIEFPDYKFDKKTYYNNREFIKKSLNPVKGLHVYFDRVENDSIVLIATAIQNLPLEIKSLKVGKKKLKGSNKQFIPGKFPKSKVKPFEFKFGLDKKVNWEERLKSKLKIKYSIYGLKNTQTIEVYPWTFRTESAALNFQKQRREMPTDRPYVKFFKSSQTALFQKGKWTIDKTLVIPEGYKLIINKGTQISLTKGANIISFGAAEFIGSEERPIVFNNPKGDGGGVFITDAKEKSILHYCRFDGLTAPKEGAWSLTGAVTFYESDVEFKFCVFQNNKSEDALNTFRGKFDIINCKFYNTQSDGFDADFCKGYIKKSSFILCKNDAIDISGSEIKIENTRILKSGDKALSAGENSQMEAYSMDIDSCEIAVTSKDRSSVIFSYSTIKNTRLGYTIYQKKPEFSGGTVISEEVSLENVDHEFMVEEGSSMSFNKKEIKPEYKNVKDLLYGNEFGKKTVK
ncbi:MAG: hypothetical protein ACI81S_001736 [Sphingobacteriales bacterium]|jgi:hypothetical protein